MLAAVAEESIWDSSTARACAKPKAHSYGLGFETWRGWERQEFECVSAWMCEGSGGSGDWGVCVCEGVGGGGGQGFLLFRAPFLRPETFAGRLPIVYAMSTAGIVK